ncbi:hypothetical protein ACHAXA_011026 [Cyclostephanos tholiformis]|uniref:Uncharacterized protein n=1 Tax=Cyclostephanos tholiformis TaxID=382380 RepID=A0ABD3RYX6_9STRA
MLWSPTSSRIPRSSIVMDVETSAELMDSASLPWPPLPPMMTTMPPMGAKVVVAAVDLVFGAILMLAAGDENDTAHHNDVDDDARNKTNADTMFMLFRRKRRSSRRRRGAPLLFCDDRLGRRKTEESRSFFERVDDMESDLISFPPPIADVFYRRRRNRTRVIAWATPMASLTAVRYVFDERGGPSDLRPPYILLLLQVDDEVRGDRVQSRARAHSSSIGGFLENVTILEMADRIRMNAWAMDKFRTRLRELYNSILINPKKSDRPFHNNIHPAPIRNDAPHTPSNDNTPNISSYVSVLTSIPSTWSLYAPVPPPPASGSIPITPPRRREFLPVSLMVFLHPVKRRGPFDSPHCRRSDDAMEDEGGEEDEDEDVDDEDDDAPPPSYSYTPSTTTPSPASASSLTNITDAHCLLYSGLLTLARTPSHEGGGGRGAGLPGGGGAPAYPTDGFGRSSQRSIPHPWPNCCLPNRHHRGTRPTVVGEGTTRLDRRRRVPFFGRDDDENAAIRYTMARADRPIAAFIFLLREELVFAGRLEFFA